MIAVNGLNQSFPASQNGYVLMVPPGGGQPMLMDAMVVANMILGSKGRMHQIGFSWTGGVLGASQLIGMHPLSLNVTFPPDFTAYQGHASSAGGTANATGNPVIVVAKAVKAAPTTFSNVGTITIAAGSVTPTFSTSGAALNFLAGDIIKITGPATPDATLANFHCTLVGYEG